jgi:hypothetical protein
VGVGEGDPRRADRTAAGDRSAQRSRHTHGRLLLFGGGEEPIVLPMAYRSKLCRSAWATPAPPSRSPSTSTCTPAWAARRPTASPHCSRANPGREASRGYHESLRGPKNETPRAPDLQERWGDTVSEGRHGRYAHGCRLRSHDWLPDEGHARPSSGRRAHRRAVGARGARRICGLGLGVGDPGHASGKEAVDGYGDRPLHRQ